MARLRRVSPRSAGWTRRRVGRGFSYRDAGGEALPREEVERIRSLAIPPAWDEVWICPHPNGHIQAVGTDAAGRRQYLYHPAWRARRDELKFDRVKGAGTRLAKARERIIDDLAGEGMPLARAAATATRLLDLGYFRIGSDAYADANGSFGLTTLERRHVRRQGDDLVFGFVGKSGIEHSIVISDPHVIASLDFMRRRRGGSPRLLAYKAEARWADLQASAVNEYIATMVAEDLTAKDFRTWHATVLAAVALAESPEPGETKASRGTGGQGGGRGGGGLPREHPDHRAPVLRRPPGHRPVRGRGDDRRDAAAAVPRRREAPGGDREGRGAPHRRRLTPRTSGRRPGRRGRTKVFPPHRPEPGGRRPDPEDAAGAQRSSRHIARNPEVDVRIRRTRRE